MKLGSVTKFDEKNKATLKKDNNVISTNCNVIVILSNLWLIWRNLESGRIVCKPYIFINGNFLSYKNRKNLSRNLRKTFFRKM